MISAVKGSINPINGSQKEEELAEIAETETIVWKHGWVTFMIMCRDCRKAFWIEFPKG